MFAAQTYQPTPTLTLSPTLEATSTPLVIPTLNITATQEITPVETTSPQPTPTQLPISLVTIYDDSLDPAWAIQNTYATVDLYNVTIKHSGKDAISIRPGADFSVVAFHVKNTASKPFLRDEVLGLSFWLNSGNDYLAIDDLALGILGSDANPYWVSSDPSIDPKLFDPIFTEKGEYLLDLNRAIPPNTWEYIEILLDDLQYDTNYKYLTGFQIKNNAGFRRTFYIDDINWMVLASGK